ncbi:hypothetical protein DFH94DRAFT_697519 [Russula ochroleuca]|uniref:Uncharacterized protein n=1 Tax=Russula ochroleuca TaxID=152965 RepID=A0A9P5JY37_9AGAM|nr:hypothetical protein DFH94DRAFT_697519 [Russula ochroleuca]
MYFRYIRTAKYYGQSPDCPLSPAALSIIDPFHPLLVIILLHLLAVLNNLYLWYRLQTYHEFVTLGQSLLSLTTVHLKVAEVCDYFPDESPHHFEFNSDSRPLEGLELQLPEIKIEPTSPPPLSALFSNPLDTLVNATVILEQSDLASPTSASSILSFEEVSPPASPINYDRVAPDLDLIGVHVPLSSPTPPSPRPLSPLPLVEEARVHNQENIPPKYRFPEPCDARHLVHPHQYLAVTTSRCSEYRPLCKVSINNLLTVPTVAYLAEATFAFPSVTPFRVHIPHHIHVKPTSPQLALQLTANLPSACGRAALFRETPNVIRELFVGSLVILNIHDFLDGRQLALFFPPENLVNLEVDQLVDCWSEWKKITTSLCDHLPFGQYLDEYEVELFVDNKLPRLPGACQEQLLYWHLAAATSSFNEPISHLNLTEDESRFWLNHVALRQTLIRQQILHGDLTRYEIRLITNPQYQGNLDVPEHLFVFVDRREYTYQWDQEIWETTLDNRNSTLVNPLEYHRAPLGTTNQQLNSAIQIAVDTA